MQTPSHMICIRSPGKVAANFLFFLNFCGYVRLAKTRLRTTLTYNEYIGEFQSNIIILNLVYNWKNEGIKLGTER